MFVNFATRFLIVALIIYVSGFFLLPTSKQNTILYLSLFLPWICLLPWTWRDVLPKHPSIYLLSGGLFYLSLSSFWSQPSGEFLLKGLKYSTYILLFISANYLVYQQFGRRYLEVVFISVLVSAFIGAGYTLYVFWPLGGIASENTFHIARLSLQKMFGGQVDPINTSSYFGIAALVCIYYLRNIKNHYIALGLLLMMSSFLVLMVITKSRGPLIFFVPSLLLLLWLTRKDSKLSKQDVVLLIGLFFGASATLFFFSEQIFQRLQEPNYRFEIWTAVLKDLNGSWLFGHGLNFSDRVQMAGDDRMYRRAHMIFLDLMRTGGLVAVAIFASFIIYLLFTALNSSFRAIQFVGVWFFYGLLCQLSNGQLILNRPSPEWLLFWLPASLIIVGHYWSKDRSQVDNLRHFEKYLRWQQKQTISRVLLKKILSVFWTSYLWLINNLKPTKRPSQKIDVLFAYRKLNSMRFDELEQQLSGLSLVNLTLPKMRNIAKVLGGVKVPYEVPLSLYPYAILAFAWMEHYQPKVILTHANGSPYLPLLKLAAEDYGAKLVHIAHCLPVENYREYSLIDMHYYFVYGQSSVDKLKKKPLLFGHTKCVLTGPWVIDKRLSIESETVEINSTGVDLLLLGSGPRFEKQADTEKVYQAVIDWANSHPTDRVLFKPHPRSDLQLWQQLLNKSQLNNCVQIDHLGEDVTNCKLAVAAYTNAVLDVAVLGVPPLWIAGPEEEDEFAYEQFFGSRVAQPEELSALLEQVLAEEIQRKTATIKFRDYHLANIGRASEVMADTIREIIRGKESFPVQEISGSNKFKLAVQ